MQSIKRKEEEKPMKIDTIGKSLLPKTDVEFIELMESDANWFIRTLEDFQQFAQSSKSPLAKLSEEVIDEFGKKLIFRNGGLAGADYSMLVDKLSAEEFETLWEYFGMSKEYSKGKDNYQCTGPGNCQSQANNYCTNNC
jgi:hypothetical protein